MTGFDVRSSDMRRSGLSDSRKNGTILTGSAAMNRFVTSPARIRSIFRRILFCVMALVAGSASAVSAPNAEVPLAMARMSTPAPVSTPGSTPVVLVLGDSLSAGYGIPLQQGWVSLLQQRIRDSGLPHRVVNASISGDTTAGGLSRLPGLLESHRPAVVVIELGANDGLRGFAPQAITAALTELVALARDAGSRALLVGVRLPPNYGAAYSEAFQRVYAEVAARQDVALAPRLLDGVAEDLGQMQPDGLHPVAAAQPQLLDNVWPALRPLLEETVAIDGMADREALITTPADQTP